jgi:hypothetical protein
MKKKAYIDNDQTKETVTYQVLINDPLVEEEFKLLGDKASQYGIMDLAGNGSILTMRIDKMSDEDSFRAILKLLAHIGAIEDVFSVTKATTWYTGQKDKYLEDVLRQNY